MEGVQGLCLGGIRAGLRLGSPVRQSCTAVCVSPASSSVAAPGLVGAIDQHSSRMTSGLFLKEALSRTEALPGATLRGGPGCPSPVQRRGPRRRCPQPTPGGVGDGTAFPAGLRPASCRVSHMRDFRLPGAEHVPCVFGGRLTCSARPATSSEFPRSPWTSEAARVPPKSVLQANTKIKPASILTNPRQPGGPAAGPGPGSPRAWGRLGSVGPDALPADGFMG